AAPPRAVMETFAVRLPPLRPVSGRGAPALAIAHDLHPDVAPPEAFRVTAFGHVDVDNAPAHLAAGVGDHILSRILAGLLDADARPERHPRWIGGPHAVTRRPARRGAAPAGVRRRGERYRAPGRERLRCSPQRLSTPEKLYGCSAQSEHEGELSSVWA